MNVKDVRHSAADTLIRCENETWHLIKQKI